ncbi:sulfotransferase domain-containing protein [Alteromonas sp. RKMC-009]|uniref:sulfotransferase domain-containing protein n=1 Tax=Alteromonas sp. RKMC-009 TaxID=2267264 RepID=UPI000E69E51B|nr:sulfotransferase domain-containing protein [Alteromonas sp. RKMC-009]AYA62830.1 hypothetical protein DS731_01750 [Alteromonas sp. RKMC-009]
MEFNELIIISGIPRSGTTIIGEVLSEVENVDFIYEPFNKITGIVDINEYFVISEETSARKITKKFIDDLKYNKLKFKKNYYPEDPIAKKIAKKIGITRNNLSYQKCRYITKPERLIIKDPFLYFLKSSFDEDNKIIITERSSFQIAASFKRMCWSFDVLEINKKLKESGLKYLKEINDFDVKNPAVNGALLNKIAKLNKNKRKNILYVDMNELIEKSEEGYKTIFDFIGIPLTPKILKYIEDRSNGKADITSIKTAHTKKRDAKSLTEYWKKILSDEEINTIERIDAIED